MSFEELDKKVSEWIYAQQLKFKASSKCSNLIATSKVSDKLESLGIERFQKELKIDSENARYAFFQARDFIVISLNNYHQQEMGIYFDE